MAIAVNRRKGAFKAFKVPIRFLSGSMFTDYRELEHPIVDGTNEEFNCTINTRASSGVNIIIAFQS